jgi:hypothetical protein
METYSFRIILADADEIVDDMTQEKLLEMSNAVFEAGCDDSSPGVCCEVVHIDFDREAASLREAVESAVAQVESAGYRVSRVEPDELSVFEEINTKLGAAQA